MSAGRWSYARADTELDMGHCDWPCGLGHLEYGCGDVSVREAKWGTWVLWGSVGFVTYALAICLVFYARITW